LCHLLADELEEVADDFDLLVYHPLLLPKLEKKRAQELGDRVGRPVA
jgi:hypothetical protein